MKIYIDTEFTGLHQNTTLISIGLVSETNKFFYAEFIDYDKSQLDDWLKENIIANLMFNDQEIVFGMHDDNQSICIKDTKNNIANHLINWLREFQEPIQIVSDVSHYDFVLFISIFGKTAFDLPEFISPYCHDINQDIARFLNISDKEAFDIDRIKFVNKYIQGGVDESVKHNSHDDAICIKYIDEIVNNKGDSLWTIK